MAGSSSAGLLIWSLGDAQADVLAKRQDLQSSLGGEVGLEVFERIQDAALPKAAYGLITTGPVYPPLPFTDEVYALLSGALAPSGRFSFQELVLSKPASGPIPPFRELAKLPLSLKLAGFTNPEITETRPLSSPEIESLATNAWGSADVASAVQSAVGAGLCVATVTAGKPSYATGSSASIKLNLRGKKAERPETRSPPPAMVGWSNSSDEGELEDEEALLDEADRAKPMKVDDCEVIGGKKKACKNCVCGRAEEEAAEQIAVVKISAEDATGAVIGSKEVKSSCGNCYLGDAFRCSTCPYTGMPAFAPGQKVQLTGIFADDDF